MYYNDQTLIYYNGDFVKAKDAAINLYSQSLHYGSSVFEGIKSYHTNNGTKIFKAKEHYDRLIGSAAYLKIPFNYTSDQLTELTYTVLTLNQLSDAYIRPILMGAPNMSLFTVQKSYLAIQAWSWDKGYMPDQVHVMISSFQRISPKSFFVEAKISGHYINSILACQEAKEKGFDEALLLDEQGNIAESSGANIFFERDGKLYTPPKGNIFPGITRNTVMDICNTMNISCEERNFKPEDIKNMDAAFFCGTAAEIVSIASVNHLSFNLKWEDTCSFKVQQAYKNLVREKELTE